MTIHETTTHLTPAEVLGQARTYFARSGPSAAFAEVIGDGFLKLHMEVGEIMIAALPNGDSTRMRGSASRGGHLLTRFLTTLGSPLDVRQTTHRYGVHEQRGAQVETVPEPAIVGDAAEAAARAAQAA